MALRHMMRYLGYLSLLSIAMIIRHITTYGALSQLRSLVGLAGPYIAGCAIWGRRWGRSAAHCTTSAVAPDEVKMLHALFECLTDTRCYTA